MKTDRKLGYEVQKYLIKKGVETPMVKKFFKDKKFKNSVLKNIPLGRLATESDVATAVVYLSSKASSMITGSSLVIDGGWTAK